MNPFTLPLENVMYSDLPLVGGKGANLGRLMQAGFNVPPGFCVTTNAFSYFMAGAGKDIFAELEKIDAGDLNQLRWIGSEVRGYLEGLPLPGEVANQAMNNWRKQGAAEAYAVRSSATAEDLPFASFAGQQDTYLNIRGEDALLASIKACFISLFTDRAILYRMQNGFNHRHVALAVVVQKMVQSDVAGILFTADPITGNRNIASIDASYGLGEALVAGLVSADLYQVDKRSHEIIKRQIASKQVAVRSLQQGGTEHVTIPENQSILPSLEDPKVIELAELGAQIERHYGEPQDIEWAIAGKELYITQSRPITSLYPLPEQDDDFHVYISLSHIQMLTEAMPPLALSLIRTLLPGGQGKEKPESKFVLDIGGRIYGDVSLILRHPIGRKALPKAYKNMEELSALAIAEFADHPRFRSDRTKLDLSKIKVVIPYAGKVLRALWQADLEGASEGANHVMNAHIADIDSRLRSASDLQTKLDIVLMESQKILLPALTWIPKLIAGILSTVVVTKLMQKKGDADDIVALGRGLTGNVVSEMGLAVGDLADAALASAALAEQLSDASIDATSRIAKAAEHPGGEQFVEQWDRFLAAYGARGPAEIDLSRPRWSEDPTSLLQMVVSGLDQRESGTHRAHFIRLQKEGEQATHRLTKLAHKGMFGWLRGRVVARLIRVSRKYSVLREQHKFLVIKYLALVKQVFLDAGEQLQGDGKIETADDIWLLTVPEVIETVGSVDARHSIIKDRRAAFEHHKLLTPPRVMSSEGEIPMVKLDGGKAPDGALLGSPVSAGVVAGIAKIVHNPSIEVLAPGEILVAVFTDPGWTPLFVNAAGLVTEVGGLMSHGSVVAREYGIPAVVGVVDATKQIKTGQHVRVYGDAGYIEILEGEVEEELSL